MVPSFGWAFRGPYVGVVEQMPNKRLKLAGAYRFNGTGVLCPGRGTACRPPPLRRRASRPQLKRGPLGSQRAPVTDHSPSIYDPAHGKRIAREVTPWAIVIGLALGWRAHEPWWLILPIGVLSGVANYWFWRACDYLFFRLTRVAR